MKKCKFAAKSGRMKKYKAAFFDMDGVLIDSMKYHCQTWVDAFAAHNIEFDPQMAYRNEGRTGASTINLAYKTQLGREATPTEIDQIYNLKTNMFKQLPPAAAIAGMADFVKQLKKDGLDLWVVTGSAQKSLISRLEDFYEDCFHPQKMVTGNDVQFGKPHPEPYLKALENSGYKADEVFVIENAPLGVEASVAANIFTVAINTGILPNHELSDKKADMVVSSVTELLHWWKRN